MRRNWKRLLPLALALWVGLCACGRTEPTAAVPLLEPGDEGTPAKIVGPAGSVEGRYFLGAWTMASAQGDLDGDGNQELVYICPGPTSGLFTLAFCVYGLEEGLPVCRAASIYCLDHGDVALQEEAGQVLFRWTPRIWKDGIEQIPAQDVRSLPLSLEAGRVVLNGDDLPEGIRFWGDGLVLEREAKTVTVHTEVPTTLENEWRWEAFLNCAAQGEADEIFLRLILPEEAWERTLAFDGAVYTLTEGGEAQTYRYLLRQEETAPAQATYRRATHYFLSDDPEMTWDRLFAHMVSSALDPGFPRCATLFTVYVDSEEAQPGEG